MEGKLEPTASQKISITPLLRRLWPSPSEQNVTAQEIAEALSYIFTDRLSSVQSGALLTCLHFTGWEQRADVLMYCAQAMREAALTVDRDTMVKIVRDRGISEGRYEGGHCDIVGTGGDSHNTFNVSTTSSILASALLLVGKHGNRASTSKSGSADVLQSTFPRAPNLLAATEKTISKIYEKTNYVFLYAPVFHPGMKYASPVRKDLGWRTIFNLLGPLTNPLEEHIEARVLGVARKDVGPVYANALKMSGVRKALVVCGDEDLDEISCAGKTHCWKLSGGSTGEAPGQDDIQIENFILSPSDFGLPSHPLSDVFPGKEPVKNADILMRLLQNKLSRDDPILHFVLINTSALFVISGICEADTSNMGYGDSGLVITERGPGGERWKEGVRRAIWAIESGEAWKQWSSFVDASHDAV
ncbi:BgTH12-07164 [Blumeria graminis f. sp. triticale]|uniref:BgtA-20892 n=3 Tax=Blumeria graminis TaxID=34373 RepID=A0A9X9QGJ3_BLUGR|nr:hypothetical protein BGT96224_A20892 [Blumeria graminis f. sp. tritici 96224]CAD6506237.1 BgTH12-07164 [Blumeria graminis f. sp. triticale]VDB94991.1 BgtA-20892 [Blumeria graminis f. sp. tritici]